MAAVEFVQAVYILYAVVSNCDDVASQAVQDCQRRRFRVNRSQARSAIDIEGLNRDPADGSIESHEVRESLVIIGVRMAALKRGRGMRGRTATARAGPELVGGLRMPSSNSFSTTALLCSSSFDA